MGGPSGPMLSSQVAAI
ncbi:DUF6053 domain-containing protein [Lysobacter yananisis]